MSTFLKKMINRSPFWDQVIYLGYLGYEKARFGLFLALQICPKNDRKIVFSSMKGERCADNPLYVTKAMLEKKTDCEIVWLLNPGVTEDVPEGVRVVNNRHRLQVIRELVTAKVWVDSNTIRSGFIKRKNQLYVQTWHGSYGLKKIGADLGGQLPRIDRRIYRYNSARTDAMISNSRMTTQIYKRALYYDGEVIEEGSPKNDILLAAAGDCRGKVDRFFDLHGERIALYAPTFRADYSTDSMQLDFEKLRKTLEEARGGSWVVLVRLHYANMEKAKDFISYSSRILNATYYNNMQELLAVSDVLVTDYSSCMFDFATTRKPCFLYATDILEYKEARGNYFEMEELPFPLAQNGGQLLANIRGFEEESYRKGLEAMFARVGLKETGHAAEAVAAYILDWMRENRRSGSEKRK